MKTKSGIEYEIKPLTLEERAVCNDMLESRKNFTFSCWVSHLRFGLKTLGGTEINDKNFSEEVNNLSAESIKEIGSTIFLENNLTDKKKSSS